MGVFSEGVLIPNTFAETGAGSGIFAPYSTQENTRPVFGLGTSGTLEDSLISYGSSGLAAYAASQQEKQLIAAGLPPGSDPAALEDPAVQAQANETALAKLATFNPELAQELAAKMQGEESEGFLGQLGNLFKPVWEAGGKLLEMISRPAQIIPELIVDPEGDPWYEDVGQALTGNSKARGADVLDKWGVENGWARGIGGFALDVLGDPLMYVGIGALGKGRAFAAGFAGKEVGASALRTSMVASGKYGDDAIEQATRLFSDKLTAVADVSPDALPGLVAEAFSTFGDEALAKMVTDATRRAQTMGTAVIRGQNLHKITSVEDIKVLQDLVKQGGATARSAAAALGGIRLRAGVPFMANARWTSAAIPFTDRVGFKTLGNFFRGTSGLTRLELKVRALGPEKLAAMGITDSAEIARSFIKGGFSNGKDGVFDLFPKLAEDLGGGALHLGSMYDRSYQRFMGLSQGVGRLTGSLTPHSNLLRQEGLAGIATYNANRYINSLPKAMFEENLTIREGDGISGKVVFTRSQVEKKLRVIRDPAKQRQMLDWLMGAQSKEFAERAVNDVSGEFRRELLDNLVRQRDGLLQGVTDPKRIDEINEQFARRAETVEQRILKAADVQTRTSPEIAEAGEMYRRLLRKIMVNGNQHGVTVLDRTIPLDAVNVMNRDDYLRWAQYGRKDVREARTVMDLGGDNVVRDTHLRGGEGQGYGYHFSVAEDSSDLPQTSEILSMFGVTPPKGWKYTTTEARAKALASAEDEYLYHGTSNRQLANIVTDGLQPNQQQYVKDQIAKRLAKGETEEQIIEALGPEAKLGVFFSNDPKEAALYAATQGNRAGQELDTLGTVLRVKKSVIKDLEQMPKSEEFMSPKSVGADTIEMLTSEGKWVPLKTKAASEVGVRLQHPLIWMDGPGGDPVQEIIATNRQVLEEQRQVLTDAHPEVNLADDEVWKKWSAEEADRAATEQFMQMNGGRADGILHYDKDGKLVGGTVFQNERVRNIKALDDRVGGVIEDQPYFPLMLSDAAVQAIGTKNPQAIFTGTADFAHEHAREFKGTMQELEDQLHKSLNLKPGQTALLWDPLEVLDKYSLRYSTEAAEVLRGKLGRTLSNLYNNAGASVDLNTYKPGKGFANPETYAKLSANIKAAYDKHYERQNRLTEKLAQQTAMWVDHAAETERAFLGEGKTMFGAGIRGLTKEARLEGENLGKEMVTTMNNLIKARKAKDWNKVEELNAHLEGLRVTRNQLRTGKLSELAPEKVGEIRAKVVQRQAAAEEKFAARLTAKERAIMRLRHNIEDAENEVAKIITRTRTKMAKQMPAMVPVKQNLTGYVRIEGIKGLEDLAFHPLIAEEFKTALGGQNIGRIRRDFRQFAQGPWKKWATVYFPGFHLRNFMGAWFNNWLGGTGLEDYINSHRITSALKGKSKYSGVAIDQKTLNYYGLGHMKGVTWDELGDMFHNHGIRSGNSMGFAGSDLATREWRRLRTGKGQSLPAKAFEKAGDVLPAPAAARWATETTENFFRQAAMLQGLRQTGGSFVGGRMFTMLRHGDYEDLNDFEQGIKDLIPFYKWLRTNTPYQLHNLIENPGFQLTAMKASDSAYDVAGMDPDEQKKHQPSWLRDAFTLPIPGTQKADGAMQVLALDLPMSDLYKGTNDYISMALPMFLPALENIVGKDFFTGAPVEDKPVPLSGWAKVPGIRQAIGGFVTTDAEGNETISQKTQNLFSAIPVFSRFSGWVYSDENSQNKRSNAVMSALFGLGLRNVGGDEALKKEELEFYYTQILPLTTQLRQLGVTLPEPDMISPEVYTYLGFTPPTDEEGTNAY